MNFIELIYERARKSRQRVAVPECTNAVMIRAAVRAAREGIADIILVGERSRVEALARDSGVELSGVKLVDVGDEAYRAQLAERYTALPNKVMGGKSVARRMADPLYMSLVMEAVGDVDCTFAGLDTTTYEVVMAATGIIGLAENTVAASCFFIVELDEYDGEKGFWIGMSDGGVTVEPSVEQLAGIAVSCCETYNALMGGGARCAMLSYSTLGSGSGPDIDRVRAAVALANAQRPDLMIDGEFQADAAISKRVAARKVRRPSAVAGQANVLVFPDIAACNIGTKLLQLLANCNTYGPLLQGFRLPVCDCSRGDTEERIFDNIALSGVLAANGRRYGR